MRRTTARTGALLLLPLFVLFTSDGWAAHCLDDPPAVEAHHHGEDHDSDDCPMGHADGMACAGGVTVPSLGQGTPATGVVERSPRVRDPDSIAGILHSHDLFRPPRV